MNSVQKGSRLTIEQETGGAIAVTGAVVPDDEAALEEAMEAARCAKGDVVMILTHTRAAPAGERDLPGRGEETAASLQALAQAVARGLDQRSNMLELIEQMSPSAVPSTAAVLQARRNSEARLELLREFESLTASEVADLAGSSATNRSALATRWRKEGRIFSVRHRGVQYFPGFQLGDDYRPLPILLPVLDALGEEAMSDWETALWFTTRTGWLDDRRPVDLLTKDPDAVLDAARCEVGEVAG